MSILVFDIEQEYRNIFGGRPYKIGKEQLPPEQKPYILNGANAESSGDQFTNRGYLLKTQHLDKDIWLPVTFFGLKKINFSFDSLLLPYTTVRISATKSVIETPLIERKGTVKELYSVDDYDITIKGFLIDENRVWPEKELDYIRGVFESDQSLGLDNALTNIFLVEGQQVVVLKADFPEVSGGRNHARPFSLTCKSDNIFNLIIDN